MTVGGDDTPYDELSSGPDGPRGGRFSRSPWLARGVGLLALAVGAVVLGPGLVSSSQRSPRADGRGPGPTATASAPTPSPSRRPGVATVWRVRGNLAADRSFAQAAMARVGRERPGAGKVLYAATLPDGGRVAVLAVRPQDLGIDVGSALEVMSLHVPPRVPVEDGDVTQSGGIASPDDLAGWAGHGTDGHVYVVVLGRPAPLTARVSGRIDYHPDGSATRRWREVGARDGSALVDLGTRTDRLVVVGPASVGASPPVLLEVDGWGGGRQPAPDVVVQGVRAASYRGPSQDGLARALTDVSTEVLDLARTDVRVVWSGRLSPQRRAALVVLRRPDGPTFQAFAVEDDTTTASDGGVGVWLQGPRSVPWSDATRVPWLFSSGEPGQDVLLVNPSGRGTASVVSAGQPPAVVHLDARGLARLPAGVGDPFGDIDTVVTVRSPSGRLVSKTQFERQQLADPYLTGR